MPWESLANFEFSYFQESSAFRKVLIQSWDPFHQSVPIGTHRRHELFFRVMWPKSENKEIYVCNETFLYYWRVLIINKPNQFYVFILFVCHLCVSIMMENGKGRSCCTVQCPHSKQTRLALLYIFVCPVARRCKLV